MRIKICVVTIALLFVSFCGCQKISIYKKTKDSSGDSGNQIDMTVSYDEPDITAYINRVRSVSADVYRDVLIGDWISGQKKTSCIVSFFNMHKDKLLKKGISNDDINEIDILFNDLIKMIEDKKSSKARTIANNISKKLCDTIYHFIPKAQTAFYNMGYYLRELTLHMEEKNEALIATAFSNELESWSVVREKLLPIYKGDVAQVDEYFNSLGKRLEE
ncbi:MAG TPA: hypothetical protein VFC76_00050, partial [Oscillospiraceae bacterium]|nr:hypothetical protein [Oscillospiraceae bacterium]